MGQLKLQNEHLDQQQEKHDAYLDVGFKLDKTIKKDGVVRRIYKK